MTKYKYTWPINFLFLELIFSGAFAVGMALLLGLLVPAYSWLLTDIWQWSPLNRWLRFVVLGAIAGALIGALLTTYAWLVETRASTLQKAVATAAVVAVCITVVVLAREHVSRWLPG